MKKIFLIIIYLQLANNICYSQQIVNKYREIIKTPKRFEIPKGYDNPNKREIFEYNNEEKEEFGESAWLVFSDRDSNSVYNKPNGEKLDFSLKFKESFYIVETKEDWIHLVKLNMPPSNFSIKNRTVTDYGWIKRKYMLLWRNSLEDPFTGIKQKVFLLKKVEDFEKIYKDKNKNLTKVFNGPETENKSKEIKIYSFYFVIKKQKQRYLLAKESKLNNYSIDIDLIGWVRESELEEWNTRLAMEPNFDSLAFEERKSNEKFHLIGYSNLKAAKDHNQQGTIKYSDVIWNNDPVKLSENKMAPSNKRRFMGNVIRFPLFRGVGKSYYRSGVIGDITVKSMSNELKKIDLLDYSKITRKVELLNLSKKKFDIVFLVEGSSEMSIAKESILKSISALRNKIGDNNLLRIGITIYRDYPEKRDDRMLKIIPLTSDISKIENSIRSISFQSVYDNDPFTVLYYAANESILRSGFNPDHTNILFVIGKGSDFKASKARRRNAINEDNECLMDYEDIVEKLSEFNINLIGLQIKNEGRYSDKMFLKQLSNFILESAKYQQETYSGIDEFFTIKLPNPYLPPFFDSKSTKLKGGAIFGKIIWPLKNASYNSEQITDSIVDNVIQIKKNVNRFSKLLNSVFIEGDKYDITSGELDPIIGSFINEVFGQDLNENMLKHILDEKYKLYTRVYLPKQIHTAKYPTLSFVVLMPKDNLERYISQLAQLAEATNYSVDRQRKVLYTTLLELFRQYSGFGMKKSELKKLSVNDLRSKMNGLDKEGFVWPKNKINFTLEDLNDPTKMSDDDIINFVNQVMKSFNALKKIKSLGNKYDFSYSSGDNIYFWIDINDTF